jgi:hypothetical protein
MFIAVPVGLISSLLRIIISVLCSTLAWICVRPKCIRTGLWLLPRIDISSVSRSFESYDAGYWSYVSMLQVDLYNRHPVRMRGIRCEARAHAGVARIL